MRFVSHIVRIALIIALTALIGLYLKVTIYHFPKSTPFQGEQWYNPYANLGPHLLRANFHAHTRSWGGITFGNNSEEEMVAAYDSMGYDIIGLSNYHRISTYHDSSDLYIPMYEHGLNLKKVHNLAIGARKVRLPGYPIHFNVHQTQQMIERTASISRLNAIAHPTMPIRDIERLTGYDLMEVGNTLGMATEHWDAALSAGRLIWCIADDDTHDLVLEPTFIKWTMIYAEEPDAESALDALRDGSHYGVESYRGACENINIVDIRIVNDTLRIQMQEPVNMINLIGQGGELKAAESKKHTITYPLGENDSYIRTEIHMDECVYYLNPVVRSNTNAISTARGTKATVCAWKTYTVRLLIFVAFGLCVLVLTKELKRLRQSLAT